MRPRLAAPLPRDQLSARAINALVRDYPELGGVLAEAGVDVAAQGGRCVADLVNGEELEVMLTSLEEATGWRVDALAGGTAT